MTRRLLLATRSLRTAPPVGPFGERGSLLRRPRLAVPPAAGNVAIAVPVIHTAPGDPVLAQAVEHRDPGDDAVMRGKFGPVLAVTSRRGLS
jgi:hypothetical protein